MEASAVDRVETEKPGSARDLIASVIGDAQRLVSLEVALPKQEAKELVARNAIAAGLIAVGGLLLLLAILVALPVLAVALLGWIAAAVWAGAYALIGVVLLLVGKSRLQLHLPPRTIESLKENKEWALRRAKSNAKQGPPAMDG